MHFTKVLLTIGQPSDLGPVRKHVIMQARDAGDLSLWCRLSSVASEKEEVGGFGSYSGGRTNETW